MIKNFSALKSAYLLVSHGSRDPRPAIALERLSYLVNDFLQSYSKFTPSKSSFSETRQTLLLDPPSTLIDVATLEFANVSLAEKITEFATIAFDKGYEQVKIIPLFLSAGVHVTEDIPIEVEKANYHLQGKIDLRIRPYLGSYEDIKMVLDQKFMKFSRGGKILLAHGSRKEGGNLPIEKIASQLGVVNAYWSITPKLEEQVLNLVKQGMKNIIIVPYFLFTGGITDAIANNITKLQKMYPHVEIFLDTPLGATTTIAQLIAQKNYKN